MANIFVRSTDGSDADNGSTWALAKATLSGAAAIDAAGDTIYLSQAHAESTASALTFNLAGTAASPTRVICGDDSAEPPTTASTSGSITTTGANGITFAGTAFGVYGITLNCGSGNSAADLVLSSTTNACAEYANCNLNLLTTAARTIKPTNADGSRVALTNVWAKFGATSQALVNGNGGNIVWNGGGITSGGSAITTLFAAGGTTKISNIQLSGLDLSAGATALNIFSATPAQRAVIRNSKLPASWSGSLVTGTLTATGERYEMYNCDSSDTNYRLWIQDYAGTTKHFTGLGAVDVTGSGRYSSTTEITRFSWITTCTANARFFTMPHETAEIRTWNDTIGSSKTATVEVIHDSQGSGTNGVLNEEDLFLRLQAQTNSGSTLAGLTNDGPADPLSTGTAQATSTTAWSGPAARANSTAYSLGDMITLASNSGRVFICKTAGTTSGSEPGGYATAVDGDSVTDNAATFKAMRRNKLAVTFTPAERGWVIGTPVACKASAVFYVDPNSFVVA